jgi:hypothetical protein
LKLILVFDSWAHEGQLYRLLQKSKERFLFRLLSPYANTFVAAHGAQFENLASPASKAVDTIVTHDFPAVRALVRDLGIPMAWTDQGPIGQNYRRSRTFNLKFRDGDCHISVLYQEFHVAKPQLLPGSQHLFTGDAFLVYKSAIRGLAVP